MLAPCFPDLRPSALAAFSLARRNRLLLQLRECTIGPTMQGLVRCPVCRQALEFQTAVHELLDGEAADEAAGFEARVTVPPSGVSVRYRLPNTLDLAAAAVFLDLPDAAWTLESRAADGVEPLPAEIEREAIAVIAADLQQSHPLVDIRIPLHCEEDDHVWSASLDIAAFLWTELDRMARRLLDEVQTLARGYGWHEGDILAMSETRRQFYLEALNP